MVQTVGLRVVRHDVHAWGMFGFNMVRIGAAKALE